MNRQLSRLYFSARLVIALVGAVALALTLIAMQPGTAAAGQHVSGFYHGEQDDHRFELALRQHGSALSGSLRFGDESGEAMTGVIVGTTVFLVRHSSPVEVWLGSVHGHTMEGRWFSSAGAGSWSASEVGARLGLEKSVSPEVIRSGVTTEPVTYTLVLTNHSDTPALAVHLKDGGLPDFFRMREITVRASWSVSIDARPNDLIETRDGLLIGSIPPGGVVTVAIHGSASPRHPGTFVNVASAGGSNTVRAQARAALIVAGTARLANAFQPATIPAGFDERVTYTISVAQAGGDGPNTVVITDETILSLLRQSSVQVRGARAEGSLESGMTLFASGNRGILAHIIVTGSAGHLERGEYPSTAVLTSAAGEPISRVTAHLTVIVCRDSSARSDRVCRDIDVDCDEDRPRDSLTDHDRRFDDDCDERRDRRGDDERPDDCDEDRPRDSLTDHDRRFDDDCDERQDEDECDDRRSLRDRECEDGRPIA